MAILGEWVLINGGLSALGVILASGHPLTVLTAFFAAPITSLNYNRSRDGNGAS